MAKESGKNEIQLHYLAKAVNWKKKNGYHGLKKENSLKKNKTMRTYFTCAIALIAVSCSQPVNKLVVFREIKMPSRSVSPMIAAWNKLDDKSLQLTVDSFFIYHKEFPLVEIDPLYKDYLYVTFIYKDTATNKQVEFDIFGNYNDRNLGDRRLKKLRNTGIYYRSYYMPNDICFSYRFIATDTIQHTKRSIADPLNGERVPYGEVKDYSWSALDLRKNEKNWNRKRYNNVKSQLIEFDYTSSILENTRKINVYLPEGYDANRPLVYPVIYLFDSFIYMNRIEVPKVLDNLIRDSKIDPMVAVFIDNPTQNSRDIELPLNFSFKNFIVAELVPYIRKNWKVTSDPHKTIIGGMSYGGLAAGFISFYTDSVFGNVLSQSGSFWRDTVLIESTANWPRADWLIKQFQTSSTRKDIRIYMDWGLQEPLILTSNRKFVRVLDQLGYDFKYTEFDGWHDWANSRKTFPGGLLYLLGKSTPEK
jgi:enterochelin esterase-like enzyme